MPYDKILHDSCSISAASLNIQNTEVTRRFRRQFDREKALRGSDVDMGPACAVGGFIGARDAEFTSGEEHHAR